MKGKASVINIIAVLSVLLLFLSLLPLLYASFYAHPLLDDFSFSRVAHIALMDGQGLIGALNAVFEYVAKVYQDWQGTFSAIFVFCMQPAIFSDNLYFLTTFILVFALTFSTFFLLDTIIVKYAGSRRSYSLVISALVLFCTFQFMLSIPDGLYWYNGACYYTLFYSISLFFFGMLIRLYLNTSKVKGWIIFAAAVFLAFFIAGGNYTTALISCCILALFVLAFTILKANKVYRYYLILAVYLISFFINVSAPGNAVRAAFFEEISKGPVEAVIDSIIEAPILIYKYTRMPQLALFIFVTPIIYEITKTAKLSFRCPLAMCILAFLCYAAQLTPSLYAQGSIGPYRQINIYYYAYYIYVLFNIFYICGYVQRKGLLAPRLEIMDKPIKLTAFTLVCALVFSFACWKSGFINLNSVRVADAVVSGTAWQYETEYMEIIEKIKNGETHVTDIKTVPEYVFHHFSWGEPGLPLDEVAINDIRLYYGL